MNLNQIVMSHEQMHQAVECYLNEHVLKSKVYVKGVSMVSQGGSFVIKLDSKPIGMPSDTVKDYPLDT